MLQKKVAVLQSQLRRRGPDHQGPDGNGLIHYTTEEHISESGKIKVGELSLPNLILLLNAYLAYIYIAQTDCYLCNARLTVRRTNCART